MYIFNLIIGVGALSLPLSFSEAGVILGTCLLIVLAFMSYMTATFMIEAMATANAYVRHKSRRKQPVVEAQSHTIQNREKNDTDYVSGCGLAFPRELHWTVDCAENCFQLKANHQGCC